MTFTTKLVHRNSHFIRFLWLLKPEKLAEKLEMRLSCDWLRDGVGCEVRWGNVVSWLRGEMM